LAVFFQAVRRFIHPIFEPLGGDSFVRITSRAAVVNTFLLFPKNKK